MARSLQWRRGKVSELVTRRAVLDDIELLKEIRLEGLRLHPEAFSSDDVREGRFTNAEWSARIAGTAWFVTLLDDAWTGIAAFRREAVTGKTAHIGSLNAMYVRAQYRGKGVGDALIAAVLEEGAKSVNLIELTVNADNARAIALYERHGFKQYGRKPRALCVDGRYYDEALMIRAVSASD